MLKSPGRGATGFIKMNEHLVAKIQARDRFFDLWRELGEGIANNPEQWGDWEQTLGRADSPLAKRISTVLSKIKAADELAAQGGF